MRMSIKPAFRYQFGSNMRSIGIFFVIFALALAAFLFFATDNNDGTGYSSFSAYGFIAAIFMFVLGISGVRSDVRLCLQYGVSRRSSFVSNILVLIVVSAILAFAGEIITAIAQTLVAVKENVFVGDIYQIIYLQEGMWGELSFGQHLLSILVNLSLLVCACIGGMFFSLLFWRLNKFWTIVIAVAIPVLLNILPIGLFRLGANIMPLLKWIALSPYNFTLFFLLVAILFAIIDWLLLRKADIKGIR